MFFILLLLCYLTGPRSDDHFLPDVGCLGGGVFLLQSHQTPPASPEGLAWVSKQPHKTLIPSSDFLIWDTSCSTERQFFCWLSAACTSSTNRRFFPCSFIHFNAPLICISTFSPPIILYLLLYLLLLFNEFISVTQRLLLYMKSERSSPRSQPHTAACVMHLSVSRSLSINLHWR